MAKYICKNFGACGKADAKEEIDVMPGTDAKCQECGATLHEVGKVAPDMGGGGPAKWIIPAALAGIALVGGGGWYAYSTYVKKPVEAVQTGVDVAKTAIDLAKAALATKGEKPGTNPMNGPIPDEAEIQALKKDSETNLVKGNAQGAEQASKRAAALEMIKTAISYLSQGDLAKAEQELNAAKERDPGQPLVYYNLAVVRVKQKRMDEALALLDTSLSKGFGGFTEMERDPDLAPLRKDARYQALIAKHRQGG